MSAVYFEDTPAADAPAWARFDDSVPRERVASATVIIRARLHILASILFTQSKKDGRKAIKAPCRRCRFNIGISNVDSSTSVELADLPVKDRDGALGGVIYRWVIDEPAPMVTGDATRRHG
jgi:hypothetical protein